MKRADPLRGWPPSSRDNLKNSSKFKKRCAIKYLKITNVSINVIIRVIENIFSQYSEEEIENFKCIFEMFDKERQGFIGVPDL